MCVSSCFIFYVFPRVLYSFLCFMFKIDFNGARRRFKVVGYKYTPLALKTHRVARRGLAEGLAGWRFIILSHSVFYVVAFRV